MEDLKADEGSDKRRKTKHRVIIILTVVVFIVAVAVIWFLSRYQNTSPERPEDRYSGTIEQFHSYVDKDGDGIDDQTDILEGALAYVSTHPKYKSKYYNTGYPDDGYGVCTASLRGVLKARKVHEGNCCRSYRSAPWRSETLLGQE